MAVVVVRDGRLPLWADDAVAEAGGQVVVVGSGTADAVAGLPSARRVQTAETGDGLAPGWLAGALAPHLAAAALVLLPASPDGRDLAPRLAAVLDRPVLARVTRAAWCAAGPAADTAADTAAGPADGTVRATVARLDDRVMVPVEVAGPAVATLVGPGDPVHRTPAATPAEVTALALGAPPSDGAEPALVALVAPDLRTMDLAHARRVVAGGAGLAAGLDDAHATAAFALLTDVAAALGGSAGATRVATDAGWTGYERQIGTTGVTIDPDLYIALGISGATQHTGGLGTPHHVVSINTDPSCPMTGLADLGIVADGAAVLVELAHRLGVDVPEALDHSRHGQPAAGATSGGSRG